MTPDGISKLQRSVDACIANGRKLLEDAEWSTHQASTGLALAMLAQEECAKAFVLALVRDEILPWTEDLRHSLSVHECKHLVMICMEWLSAINELRENEIFSQSAINETSSSQVRNLPPDVAKAMNIYRHENIERIGKRRPDRYSEWNGAARKAADGKRDRKKQLALYVGIGPDGDVASLPPTSTVEFDQEFTRAKALCEFADDVGRKCIFAYREYELFADVFGSMFKDLAPGFDGGDEEIFPSGIPGIVMVRRTITVAEVVPAEPTEDANSEHQDSFA